MSEKPFKFSNIVVSGLGWSYPCDAFSLGCIFVEFYTGVALYQTHDNLEHLAMMEMVMGRMPDRFAREGAASKAEYFKDGAKLDWPKPKVTKQSRRDVKGTKPLVVSHFCHSYLCVWTTMLTRVYRRSFDRRTSSIDTSSTSSSSYWSLTPLFE